MHCTVHFLIVPVGGVGLSGAGLCSYLSVCSVCVSLAYGCAFHLACLVVSVGLFLQQPVSHGGLLVQFVVITLVHFPLSGEVVAHVATVGFPFYFCIAVVWWPRGS